MLVRFRRFVLVLAAATLLAPHARAGEAPPRVLEIVPANGVGGIAPGPGEIRIAYVAGPPARRRIVVRRIER